MSQRNRALFLLVFLSLCPGAFGQPERQALPAGVELKIAAEPQRAAVGDPIRIDLAIILPAGYQASVPPLGKEVGDFTILEFHPGPSYPDARSLPVAENKSQHLARVVVALYKVGEFEFPPIPFTLRDPSGKESAGASPSIKIQIQSILTAQDITPKDLKKQAEFREPFQWLLWLALALLAFLGALLLRWWWRRRRHPEVAQPLQPQLDPFALAEAELRDLLSQGLPEKGLTKQFYVILSDITKKVLEAGYGIRTVEQTTSEITEQLQNLQINREDLQRIESFLSHNDLVKFAKYHPSKSENGAAVESAFQILEAGRRFRRVPVELQRAPLPGTP